MLAWIETHIVRVALGSAALFWLIYEMSALLFAYIALVTGRRPPESILPVVDRLSDAMLGVLIVVIVSAIVASACADGSHPAAAATKWMGREVGLASTAKTDALSVPRNTRGPS